MNDPLLSTERFIRRQKRFVKRVCVAAGVFYFSLVLLLTVLGHLGYVHVIATIGIVLGIAGIVFGLGLIAHLLLRPPFSTGEWLGLIIGLSKDLRSLLRR